MSNFRLGPIAACVYSDPSSHGAWVRWFRSKSPDFGLGGRGWGLSVKGPRSSPMFSEREGHRKPIARFRGWRLFVLRPDWSGT